MQVVGPTHTIPESEYPRYAELSGYSLEQVREFFRMAHELDSNRYGVIYDLTADDLLRPVEMTHFGLLEEVWTDPPRDAAKSAS